MTLEGGTGFEKPFKGYALFYFNGLKDERTWLRSATEEDMPHAERA